MREDNICQFPMCTRIVVRDGFCVSHAPYFAAPKVAKQRKKIPQFSAKQKKVNRELKKIVDKKKEVNPDCEIKSPVCTGKAQGSAHLQKRSPKNLLIVENIKIGCNACNGYCEQFPGWAKENGHFVSKFSKAV